MQLTMSCKGKTGGNVLVLKRGEIFEDLFTGHASSKILQHVTHSDAIPRIQGCPLRLSGSMVMRSWKLMGISILDSISFATPKRHAVGKVAPAYANH